MLDGLMQYYYYLQSLLYCIISWRGITKWKQFSCCWKSAISLFEANYVTHGISPCDVHQLDPKAQTHQIQFSEKAVKHLKVPKGLFILPRDSPR